MQNASIQKRGDLGAWTSKLLNMASTQPRPQSALANAHQPT